MWKGVRLLSSNTTAFLFQLTISAASAAKLPSRNISDGGTPMKKPHPRKVPTQISTKACSKQWRGRQGTIQIYGRSPGKALIRHVLFPSRHWFRGLSRPKASRPIGQTLQVPAWLPTPTMMRLWPRTNIWGPELESCQTRYWCKQRYRQASATSQSQANIHQRTVSGRGLPRWIPNLSRTTSRNTRQHRPVPNPVRRTRLPAPNPIRRTLQHRPVPSPVRRISMIQQTRVFFFSPQIQFHSMSQCSILETVWRPFQPQHISWLRVLPKDRSSRKIIVSYQAPAPSSQCHIAQNHTVFLKPPKHSQCWKLSMSRISTAFQMWILLSTMALRPTGFLSSRPRIAGLESYQRTTCGITNRAICAVDDGMVPPQLSNRR